MAQVGATLVKQLVSLVLLFVLIVVATSANVYGQAAKPKPKTRILFLLDASGSMLAKWEDSDRMQIAKKMLANLADSLNGYDNLEIALRVYGHQFGRESNNCKDTKLEVPFAAKNAGAIKKKLQQIIPRGNTPITYSLQQTAGDFPVDPDARNVVMLITDGLDSCGGDPCETSLALQKKGIFLRPFIIGIGIAKEYENQLSCIGQYFDATNVETFEHVLSDIVNLALAPTTVSVALENMKGQATVSNVNMTFLNSLTGKAEYNFVHYLDAQGKPDQLNIDALVSYNLVINTTPPVIKKDVTFEPGKHNVIRVFAPQGELFLSHGSTSPYGQLATIVRLAGSDQTLCVQRFGERQKYLVGKYDLELLTLPRIVMKGVDIIDGQTSTIKYPAPGQLNVSSQLQGYGSLYLLHEDGAQEWIYNLPEQNSRVVLAMQPGKYRIVYRLKSALGSEFTDVQDFTISSSTTTTVKIFNR
ncbi:vWA domain-containing protein [Pontibacter harenae]|uniref:vWA domain-containing protein n=1 Tax=Pontibacter harenae TaxID=2894083 RepID=UPI001E2F8435|nr:VWA domain-containing protein [Pontibacter harenae]MCC9165749.1 VWA domain-containing protein [Pontibacter harenae]